tara:strand:- start:377 stop:529 length:153 start_codon:yes stop_codon:yes gene_type:complete
MREDRPKLESFKVETPLGSLESDSGSHVVDVISVVAVMMVLLMAKKMFGK